jgi:hypothetical protein
MGVGRWQMLGENIKVLMAEPHASKHDDYLARYAIQTGASQGSNHSTALQCLPTSCMRGLGPTQIISLFRLVP